jgi:hypothetical protein
MHPLVPPDPVEGTKTFAGVTCEVYPLHGQFEGSICVDMKNDILGEVQSRWEQDGVRHDHLRQLTWIDLKNAPDATLFRIPDDFMTVTSAQ